MLNLRTRIIGATAAAITVTTGAITTSALACEPLDQLVSLTAVHEERKPIDLVICLDTSGSMTKLIDAARQKLWAIVNDLATANPMPELRVALLTYGSPSYPQEDGWVKLNTPLTTDLDLVSQRLFELGTNGGTELVGRVLNRSLSQLEWTPGNDALKLIVVAGNESADQDTDVNFRDMCRKAISSGIMVNSIYCGPVADNIAPGWKEIATLSDGKFAAIDMNHGTVIVSTPLDESLAELSAAINDTYIPYGKHGALGCEQQRAQDGNAESLNGAAVAQRAVTKASALYQNDRWDLVDACKNDAVSVEEVSVEELPENMKAMTIEERKAHVKQLETRRAELQKQIADLQAQRQAYIAEEMKKQALDETKSFDFAVRNAIREQAASKGFVFAAIAAPSEAEGEEAESESTTAKKDDRS